MTNLLKPKVKSTFKLGLWLGCLSYLAVLCCVIISNLSLFDPNWPFGLFASFTPTLFFCLPVVLLVAVKLSRPLTIIIILSGILAFYRFVSFDHYVSPAGSDCSEGDCTTIVMTNLRRSEPAVETLAQMLGVDFDVLVLTEVPPALSTRDLETLFGGSVSRPPGPKQHLGSRLAIISRLPEVRFSISRRIMPQGETTPRAYQVLQSEDTTSIRPQIIGVHPVWPKTAGRMAARNDYLASVAEHLTGDNFVIIGDFNLTPWEPVFSTLPGRRAGNPRWLRTWNANDPFQRLAIDHALVGPGVEVVAAVVLDDVGSDHFPIRVVVKPKG